MAFTLEAHAHPPMPRFLARVAVRGHGVGEGKKRAFVTARSIQALEQQVELVIEHRLETFPADIALAGPVNRVAYAHVVGGNGFGDSARRAAHVEKPARDFLPRADLGEGAVALGVQIDLESLMVGVNSFVVHAFPALPMAAAPQSKDK